MNHLVDVDGLGLCSWLDDQISMVHYSGMMEWWRFDQNGRVCSEVHDDGFVGFE